MICILNVDLRKNRMALVRVLRVLEHRSNRLYDVSASTTHDGCSVVVEATVDSCLPPRILADQLRKLYDVERVSVRGMEMIADAAARAPAAAG